MDDIFKKQDNSFYLSLNNVSKHHLLDIANQISKSVYDGKEYALQTYIKAKGLEEIAKSVQESVKQMAIDDAHDYSKGETVLGCELVIKSTPTSYDFSHNEEWTELNNQITKLKEQQKEIEKQMIQATTVAQLVTNDGVVVEPAVIKKQGGQTLQINMPK